MSSSEAVMVSPEQCATAPKSITKGLSPVQQQTSSTRLVLLAVLALAAATGAMFGVVVFGNEFTKDVHPQGSSHLNSVTLVDSNDRAVATADVQSYVSLLDLPLLGTAELNKVDGITFSTYKGIEHRKVTGYTITKETAPVGDSTVSTPRLSMRSEPGITIEISVRDAKAWIEDNSESGKTSTTSIDATPTRRLADGAGSCLSSGACLYSRDELLSLDAETRSLTEGSFFARADVAAYQVDLNGEDIMKHVSAADLRMSYLQGEYLEDDHKMLVRMQQSSASAAIYLKNTTSGDARLITRNGTFTFRSDSLYRCTATSSKPRAMLDNLDLDALKSNKGGIKFTEVMVNHGREMKEGFIPHAELTENDCTVFSTMKGNFSDPDVQMEYLGRTFSMQGFSGGNLQRKLATQIMQPLSHKERTELHRQEKMALMMDANNERNQMLKLMSESRKLVSVERQLAGPGGGERNYTTETFENSSGYVPPGLDSEQYNEAALMYDYAPYTQTFGRSPVNSGVTYITHFDLWLATRLADPSFINEDYADDNIDDEQYYHDILGLGAEGTFANYFAATTALNLAGSEGISRAFKYWAGLRESNHRYLPPGLIDDINDVTDSSKTTTVASTMTTAYCADSNNHLPDSDCTTDKKTGKTTCKHPTCLSERTSENWPAQDKVPYKWSAKASAVEDIGLDTMFSKAFIHAMFPGACSGGYEADQSTMMEVMADYLDTQDWFGEYFDLEFGWNHQFSADMCKFAIDTGITEFFEEYKDTAGAGANLDNLFTIMHEVCDLAIQLDVEDDGHIEMPDLVTNTIRIRYPNSWASYMYKDIDAGGTSYDPEYIVAFQGTKPTDLTMIQYNTRQTPIFTYIGESPFIIPHGYFDYMASLVDCLDDFIDNWQTKTNAGTTQTTSPTFITGHSLGGAAATLYAASRASWNPTSSNVGDYYSGHTVDTATYPRLVTFGAAPTAYKGSAPGTGTYDTKIKCVQPATAKTSYEWNLYCTGDTDRRLAPLPGAGTNFGNFDPALWDDFMSDGVGNTCSKGSPQSVRFVHKFDPVPSIAMWKGNYGHTPEHAVMLMDKYQTSCKDDHHGCMLTTSSIDAAYQAQQGADWDLGMGGSNPYLVPEWLCTKVGVTPVAWATSCVDQFSSYFSIFNPFPCGQITFMNKFREILQGTWEWDIFGSVVGDNIADGIRTTTKDVFGGQEGEITLWSIDGIPFKVDLYQLQYGLYNDVETMGLCTADWLATVDAYVVASIADLWFTFGFMFTVSFVHSSYAMYPLCVGNKNGAGDAVRTVVGANPDSHFGDFYTASNNPYVAQESTCTAQQYADVDAFCERGQYWMSGTCNSCGYENCEPCCFEHMEVDDNGNTLSDAWHSWCETNGYHDYYGEQEEEASS